MSAVAFTFEGKKFEARKNEAISSALFASGVQTFGLHHKDGSPQGIFCANGQCAQCMVIANGRPVKACMTPVTEGMEVEKLVNLPVLPEVSVGKISFEDIEELSCDLLVVGAGPAGLSAAIEAGKAGVSVLVVDDKDRAGGKLVLQTHQFFGSAAECFAGTRGVDIAGILSFEAEDCPNIRLMPSTTALGIYADGKVGVTSNGVYKLVRPKAMLVSAGAREKALAFPGSDLPGVYGAGAFQTLVNRDLVAPSNNIFIVGGGNVGLIAAYHAMQAGIRVAGLCEALKEVGGYWVHADKIKRLGVPIYTSTTIISANGKERVESVTIADVNEKFRVLPHTHRTIPCDTVLVAVGLERSDELYNAAVRCKIPAFMAGDAEEIAEASAAMFSGRMAGRKIAASLGKRADIPREWTLLLETLKAKPGRENAEIKIPKDKKIFPVIRCTERIPCSPCMEACPRGAIELQGGDGILSMPVFDGVCTGCGKCVATCPGLAISLVDLRENESGKAKVTIPFEMPIAFKEGDFVEITGHKGDDLGQARVASIMKKRTYAQCRSECPAGVRAPRYIELIRKKKFAEAAMVLREDIPLPAVCGKVCYAPCEANCSRGEVDEGVAVALLKSFAADWAIENMSAPERLPIKRKERVAVVGSGPAGLACANEILRRGYAVTVFEAREKAGGLLRYGIPAYRLPENILDAELELLKDLGIKIVTGSKVGDTADLLKDGFSAVFVAKGAGQSSKLGIDGEGSEGVIGAIDFLSAVKEGKGKWPKGRVVVIGGGNSAIDSARSALRLGAKDVRILYRRTRNEMPAHAPEIAEALSEGVKFEFLTAPVSICAPHGKVENVRCVRMKLGSPDVSGRPRPEPVAGSEFELEAALLISAVGQTLQEEDRLSADPLTQETSTRCIFAGGDMTTGAENVAKAFGAGKRAAESIGRFLRGFDVRAGRAEKMEAGVLTKRPEVDSAKRARAQRLTEEEAVFEADRCLNCGSYAENLPGAELLARCISVNVEAKTRDDSVLVTLETSPKIAVKTAGIKIQEGASAEKCPAQTKNEDVIICRCERISEEKISKLIRSGVRDMNQLKAMLKVGMGACGGKTCGATIKGIFRKEGIPLSEVTPFTERPLVTEAPMGVFAGVKTRCHCEE